LWNADSLNIIVFVQSTASMSVYQSETINYSELSVTGLENIEKSPAEFILEQNYPNPFNPSTTIRYSVPTVIASEAKQSQLITLKVYDVLGNEVATLVNDEQQAGSHSVNFNSAGLASGIYFYKLQAGNFITTKKMVIMK
jgi:hypothetical protein